MKTLNYRHFKYAYSLVCLTLLLLPGVIYCQSPVIYGKPLHNNTAIKINLTTQKNALKEVVDTVFYGKCELEVNNFLRATGVNTVFKARENEINNSGSPANEKRKEGQNIIDEEIISEGMRDSFEKNTRAFYGDSYDLLDKTILEITQFDTRDGEKMVCKNKVIMVNRPDGESPLKGKIIVEDREDSITNIKSTITKGEGYKITTLDSSFVFKGGEQMKIQKVMIQKASSESNVVPAETTTVTPENNVLKNISISPNPSKGHLNLSISFYKNSNALIRIIDITGREVYAESLKGLPLQYDKSLDLSMFGKGIYIVSVTSEGQLLGKEKFILE